MARKRTARTGTRSRTVRRTAGRGRARRRAAGKKVPVGVLAWTALVLLILVVFLFNRLTIRDVLARTDLVEVLQRSMDNAIGREDPAPVLPPASASPASGPTPPDNGATGPNTTPPEGASGSAEPEPAVVEIAPDDGVSTGAGDAPAPPRSIREPPPAPAPWAAAQPPQSPRSPPVRHLHLFFATVDQAGSIAVTGVTRIAGRSAAPLTDTIVNLLAGPDPDELGRGLVTLIPPAVTLNRVYIRERVAYIDVSESFRFNRLGREGLDAQLRQVVFSATQFPNVEQVQILIDGERVAYLGSEGMFIGEPIGAASFQ